MDKQAKQVVIAGVALIPVVIGLAIALYPHLPTWLLWVSIGAR